MKYEQALKSFKKKHSCPFCDEKKENILESRKYFYVIPARSPYAPDHILIVPQRHICLLKSLEHKELMQMHELVDRRDKKLHKYHKNVCLLLRDGLSKINIGKSVNHLHFHLIPDHQVYVMNDKDSNNRAFLDDKKYKKVAQKMKNKFLIQPPKKTSKT